MSDSTYSVRPVCTAALGLIQLYLIGLCDILMVHTMNEDQLLALVGGTAVITCFTDYPLYLSIVRTVNTSGGLLAVDLLLLRHLWTPETAFISSSAVLLLISITFSIFDSLETFGTAY